MPAAPNLATAPVCDLERLSEQWPEPLASTLRQLAQQALDQLILNHHATPGGFVLCLDDDHAITQLNQQWRNKNTPTNVLAFPSSPLMPDHNGHRHLGDVIIAFETADREAKTLGISLLEHTTHLAVHGLLHLLGHDHQKTDQQSAMEQLENSTLAALGFASPYEEPSCQKKQPD